MQKNKKLILKASTLLKFEINHIVVENYGLNEGKYLFTLFW